MNDFQLVRYDAARSALQAANSVDEVKDVRDKAQAMAAYARQAKDTELVEWATEIKVRAERRAGEMLAAMPKLNGARGVGKKVESHDATPLSDLGVTKSQSSRWQKLAAVPAAQFEQAVAAAKEVAGEVTTAAMLRLNRRNDFTGEIEWYTPEEYIKAARAVMGGIDLDPASSKAAQKTVNAKNFFTIEQDGLKQVWKGRIWLNPPYGSSIAEFVSKLVAEFSSGSVTEAVLLTHNSCDTGWWHEAHGACSAFLHTRGRVNFVRSDGFTASPPLGQTFFYLGKRKQTFAKEFGKFGCASSPWTTA